MEQVRVWGSCGEGDKITQWMVLCCCHSSCFLPLASDKEKELQKTMSKLQCAVNESILKLTLSAVTVTSQLHPPSRPNLDFFLFLSLSSTDCRINDPRQTPSLISFYLVNEHVRIHALVGFCWLPIEANLIISTNPRCVVSGYTQSFSMCSFLAAETEKSVYVGGNSH